MISEAKLKKIQALIEKKYNHLLVSFFGEKDLPASVRAELKSKGIKLKDLRSFLSQAYQHNIQKHPTFNPIPTQPLRPRKVSARGLTMENFSMQQLNGAVAQRLGKMRDDMQVQLEGIIRQTNQNFKFEALNAPDRPAVTLMTKTRTQLKSALAGYAKDANRNWNRVVYTEVSNAIGMASAERIIQDNAEDGVSPSNTVVYRIIVDDGHTCPHCRRFYLDGDGTPAIYLLSDLITNGSNYGKKAAEWRPCLTATHPNERCSPILELRPGWKVLPGGGQTFIGNDSWESYVKAKIR